MMKKMPNPKMRMHLSMLKLTMIAVFAALMQSGTSRGSGGYGATGAEMRNTFHFSGKVVDNRGKGIGGVVVNDGYSFTRTARDGSWKLSTDTTRSKFVSISIPAAYEIHTDGVLADGFFVPVSKIAKSKKYTFKLTPRKTRTDNFCYVAISDPQIANEHDFARWTKESVPDLRHTIDSVAKGREVVGIALGDIVFDRMDYYKRYIESLKGLGMEMFHCIGNHDFDKRFKTLPKMPAGSPSFAEMMYNRWFGPTSYSFNIGKIHVITLKDIDYDGNGRYTERLPEAQLEWLKKDLSYVPKGTTVFVNMHAAAWNTIHKGGNIRNASDLEAALKGYNVHVFCGHTHYFQNVVVNKNLYQHNIGAVCGAWWESEVNRCGAPNGYLVVDVTGNNVRWHYKPTGKPFTYQMRIYKKGTFSSDKDCIVANVWDWDSDCSVRWYQDGRYMGEMEKFVGADPIFAAKKNPNDKPVLTGHLFKAQPASGAHNVKVEFTNRFGEKYYDSIVVGKGSSH